MTSDREIRLRYADLLRGADDGDLLHLVADLHHVMQLSDFPDDLAARLERSLRERGNVPVQHHDLEHRQRGFPRVLCHAALIVATIVMALTVGAAQRALDPAPVSAQVILQRLAAIHLPPYQALHLVYRSWSTGYRTGRQETWLEWNRHGNLARVSEVDRTWIGGEIVEMVHSVQSGGVIRTYRYLPESLVVFVNTYPISRLDSAFLGKADLADGAGVQRYLADLAHHPRWDARLLPDRTLDGVAVHVVRVRPARGYPAAILYIDARNYILRGIDGGSEAGRQVDSLRLLEEQVVPRSTVPPQVFKLEPHGLMVVHEP